MEQWKTIVEPTVEIVVSYDPPSTFTLSPPSYRAASPLSLTCEVQGMQDYSAVFYQWTYPHYVTSLQNTGSGDTISTPYLHSRDTGVYTCMVFGIASSASITVNVVGAGIFVPSGSRVLSNNSLITTVSEAVRFIPSFRCLSGSTDPNVGNLIGPLGRDTTLSDTDPFLIIRGGPGDPGTLNIRSVRPLGPNDTGIYTYHTPDQNGEIVDFHFGLYSSNSVPPFCSDLDYVLTEDLHILTCVSHGSPPTQVMWERDGERIYQNDTNYQFSQILVERTSSTYNNTLTINGTIEDVVGEYSCTVSNTLGSSNETTKTFQALELSSHYVTLYVGGSMDISCSTHLEVTKMEWLLVGVAEPLEQRKDGGQNLTLVLNPTDTELDRENYTCRVTTKAGSVFQDFFTLEVKGIVHNVSIDGAANPLSAGDKYTLTCNVTAEFPHSVKWRDSNNTEVSDPDIAMVTVSEGNTTSLLLHFDPLKTSHAGTYTCVSSISEPTSIKMATKNLQVQITSDSITVTRYPAADTLFTSNELNITCVTTVNQAVDTPVQITLQWDGPGGVVSTDNETDVGGVTSSGRDYSSTVFFNSLRSSHSGTYTCSSTVSAVEASDLIATSAIQTASTSFNAIPDEWAIVGIQNSTGENALNNTDYILTCTVTVIEGITLPVTVEWVGPDGDVVTSEGNRMVGEVEVQGTVSTLSLSFSPVFSSDGGSYTCRAAISVPWLGSDPVQLQATVDMLVTSQALLRLRIYPGLPLCINWNAAGAVDLEALIKSHVVKAVRERCNCDFSSSAIYSGQFSCVFGSSESECDLATYVTYRAVLNGTSDLLPANQLMGHIQDWRETRGTLIYNVFYLRLASNAECAVSVNSLEDAEC